MQGKLSRPTRDPAMNPVTASATFHVGQFLEDIVGVATTRGDMSATFPTKLDSISAVCDAIYQGMFALILIIIPNQ
jgi:hypothetical protein